MHWNMNLPDRIFALGGAGKAITYELLRADWVQEAVLRPRPEPEQLTVTIIDTAEEEINRDLECIQEIEAEIESTKNRLRDTDQGRPGEISIEYLPLTKNIQLHDQNDLIGENIIPRITSGRGMDEQNWWLRPEYINENLDFTTGVVRKRGLGKGLYYKAYAEDDDVKTSIDLVGRGKVAVIAGLGGGTGSGILLDLVSDLKETHRSAEITLFGVLPNDSEGKAENANAHAALSEMEYLSLHGESDFKDQILIPIDPTDFGGKKANILQSSEALEEFDQAAVYLIASYYNMMDMEDPFDDMPSYASFIIGIPQVLRYNVDAIKDAKSSLTEILTAKEDALEAEADIYAEVERFLTKHRYDESTGELHDTDRNDLETRMSNVKSLVDLDLFDELDYESVSIFREIINEAERETDEVVEQIEIAGGSVRAGTAQVDSEEGFVDSIDKQLFDIISDELNHIARRQEIIKKIRSIGNNRIESTLSYLVALQDEGVNAGVRLNQLESKLEEAEGRHERLEQELEDATEELENRRREQEGEVEEQVSSWRENINDIHAELEDCRSISVDSLVHSLETELSNFAKKIENAETEEQLKAVSDSDVRQILNNLASEFEAIGVAITEDQREINSSLANLRDAKMSFLQMNEEEGLIDKYSPFTTSAEEEREKAEKNYRMKRTEVENGDIFNISRTGEELSIELEFSGETFARTLDREAEERKRRILNEAHERVDNVNGSIDSLERKLEQGTTLEELTQTVREIFEETVIETEEIEERKQQLDNELTDAKKELDLYNGTVDLFQDINNRREAFVRAQSEHMDSRNSYGEAEEVAVASDRDEYNYIKKIKPNDVLQLRDDTSIDESDLFSTRAERQRLQGSLEELAQKAQDPKYNGLRKRRLSSDQKRYTDMNLVVGVMSPAIDQIAQEADLQSVFQGAYNLGPGGDNYASYPVESGGSWDIGLGIFIGGIFLDNIRAEVEPEGYFTSYRTREGSDGVDILIHHTHGLDEGHYVKRDEVLNMENTNNLEFFLRNEGDIKEDLLTEYIKTIDIGNESDEEVDPEMEKSERSED